MKIEEQVLSIEQMKHLQELGIDTSDASMQYRLIHDVEEPPYWELEIHEQDVISFDDEDVIYTYTIGDLIEKVSKLFNGFDFSEGKSKDMLYYCLCWMAKNKKELIK